MVSSDPMWKNLDARFWSSIVFNGVGRRRGVGLRREGFTAGLGEEEGSPHRDLQSMTVAT
jgi:hypothetical protein